MHPFPAFDELGIAEPDGYELVIDARSPHEYADDHIPGAVNLPVVDDAQYAEVGTLYRTDPHGAYVVGAQYALRNIAAHVAAAVAAVPADRPLLVYCFRGGKRSQVWAENLRAIGYRTDVLKGGWRRYREWVRRGLEVLPRQLRLCLVDGATGCGKTRLLGALQRHGEQVLDLEALAVHRGSLLGDLPGRPQPPQKLFDSLLFDRLRRLDPQRRIWVEAESRRIGRLQLPPALADAMQRAPESVHLHAPLPARVNRLLQDYAHFTADLPAMVARLASLKPLVGGQEMQCWHDLAALGDAAALFERLMVAHYDPCYERSRRHAAQHPAARPVPLARLDDAALDDVAAQLARRP